jgi:hypothetical protein
MESNRIERKAKGRDVGRGWTGWPEKGSSLHGWDCAVNSANSSEKY